MQRKKNLTNESNTPIKYSYKPKVNNNPILKGAQDTIEYITGKDANI